MAKNTYKVDEAYKDDFDIRHLKLAFPYVKKYVKRMGFAMLLSGLGGILGLISPILTQKALDEAVPQKNVNMLINLVITLVIVFILGIVFTTIRSYMMINVSQNIIYDIRKDLFAHLQKLSFQYYDDRPHGKILIRVVNYVNSVSNMLSNGLISIILETMNLIFIVCFMLAVDVQLSLIVLCGVPVLAVFLFWIKGKQRKAWRAVSNKNSNLNAYLQENIVGARITQMFAREDENSDIFGGLCKDCKGTWMWAVRWSNLV